VGLQPQKNRDITKICFFFRHSLKARDGMTEESKTDLSEGRNLPPMFQAAVAASAIPMILGFVGLYISWVPTSFGPGRFQDFIFTVPIAFCFAFGTPLVAWLSCKNLKSETDSDIEKRFTLLYVWPTALKNSFYVQGSAFLIQLTLLTAFSVGARVETFGAGLFYGGLINAVLFVLVTMPMSVFCTAVFALVYPATKGSHLPEDRHDTAATPAELRVKQIDVNIRN